MNAPDILSYHWYRYHERRAKGIQQPRKDLTALLRPHDMVADCADDRMDELQRLVAADFWANLSQ